MIILAGDIKFVKSQVMDDVPEGGGAPTSHVVIDGASNEIFADISEADRAIGRVSQRKIHLSIQSNDTDTFLGGNVIVARPPNDPNVAITIFSTGDVFDTRSAATARLEAYLSIGPNYAGFLYGNHIEGQRTVQILQRTPELPPIGATMVLTKREGYSDELRQYIRVTEAVVVERTFTDASGDYNRYVLTLTLSDALRVDFLGFDPQRSDPVKSALALATKVSESIVADAARYYGVVELEEAASIGDFTIKAAGIFTQLVPSAQVETAISDSRTNQQSAVPTSTGGAGVLRRYGGIFSNNVDPYSIFLGGGVTPGTFSSEGAFVGFDRGGILYTGAAQAGTIDYENGILFFPTGLSPSGGSVLSATYTPAAVPTVVTQSAGFRVTAENRSLNYVRTIEPPPLPGSLSISYPVNGRWYVLRDDGSGALRGLNSSYGAGTVNPTTGTVAVTLGALPDAGGAIIFQYAENDTARQTSDLVLDNNGKFYFPFNSSGANVNTPGAKPIQPGTLAMTWLDTSGGSPQTRNVADDGAGNITGYGTGVVDYAHGLIRYSPTFLPIKGTPVNVAINSAPKIAATVVVASGAGSLGATGITPGSVGMVLSGQLRFSYNGGPVTNWGPPVSYRVVDDSAGHLVVLLGTNRVQVGTINYAAGTFALTADTVLNLSVALALTAFDNIYLSSSNGLNMFVESI